ncbi:protocadherin alpha-11-like [Ochlerotatus camptorhynchus]|uniref:protocadherin alpha-11-like n=1 Tax=Ochlerotatus camptorhynchus TaxID=644619 RepID=UPI0031D49ABF
MIPIRGWTLVAGMIGLVLSQDCQSDTYNFTRHYNISQQLDLTTQPNQVIASFVVSKTLSASTTNEYLQVKVEDNLLSFTTAAKFVEYEKLEVTTRLNLLITFTCQTGSLVGSYYQDLLEANNHAPEFSRSEYETTVPLPLPKNFDLSPFIDDGKGVVAVDHDLVNNTVDFAVGDNQYVKVESVKVSPKVFRGVLKLKEQVLKLPEVIELDIVATDQGVPAKSVSAKVIIKPDLTIEYNDPPAFKRTFVQEDFDSEAGNAVVVELIPGTVHEAVEYTLVGEDASYFKLSAAEDKSKATVVLNKEPKPPKGKYFLSVVVEAKRSALQTSECVILIDLKESAPPEGGVNGTVVEKTLSILHLEEERIHTQVFPSKVDDCWYGIVYQIPNRTESIFHVDELTNWIVSSEFDREDVDLFKDVDLPQFQLVLQLNCPPSEGDAVSPPVFVDEIPYSVDTTYISVFVDDINDNAPVFTFPKQDDVFAFPVARISERLLPSRLLQVTANDLDAGLNSVIRFSVTQNDHFSIDPKTGVVYPMKNALDGEEVIQLEILATDRDGAADGNVAKLKIQVVPAVSYQLSVLQVEGVDEHQLVEYIDKLQTQSGFVIRTVTGGYTSLVDARTRETDSNTVQRLIVVAFDRKKELVSSEDLARSLEPLNGVTVSNLEILGCFNQQPEDDDDGCTVYPYIVVMSVFIVMFVATSALSAYFWFKWRLLVSPGQLSDPSNQSDNVLVENPYTNAGSTPPVKRKDIDGATVDYSSDSVSRSNRLAPKLSGMLIINEDEGEGTTAVLTTEPQAESPDGNRQRKKSIRFSEDVERIEVFEHYLSS